MAVSSEEQKRIEEAAASAASENSPAAGTPPTPTSIPGAGVIKPGGDLAADEALRLRFGPVPETGFNPFKWLASLASQAPAPLDPNNPNPVDNLRQRHAAELRNNPFAYDAPPSVAAPTPAAGMPPPGASLANMGAEIFGGLYNNPPDRGPLVTQASQADKGVEESPDPNNIYGGFSAKGVWEGLKAAVSSPLATPGDLSPEVKTAVSLSTAPTGTDTSLAPTGVAPPDSPVSPIFQAPRSFEGVVKSTPERSVAEQAVDAVKGRPDLTSTNEYLPRGVEHFDYGGIDSVANTSPDEPAGMVKPKADDTGAPKVSMKERMATQAEMKAGSAPTVRQFETPYGSVEFGLGAPKKEIKLGEWNTPSSTPDWIAKANEYARNNPMTVERVQQALSVKDPSPEQVREAEARNAETARIAEAYRAEQRDKRARADAMGSVRVTSADERETALRNATVGFDTNTPHGAFMANKATNALQAQYGAENAARANMAAELYKADRLQQTGQQKADTQYQLGMLRHDAAQMNADTRKEVAQMKLSQGAWKPVYKEVSDGVGGTRKVLVGYHDPHTNAMQPVGEQQGDGEPAPKEIADKYPAFSKLWPTASPAEREAIMRHLKAGTLPEPTKK